MLLITFPCWRQTGIIVLSDCLGHSEGQGCQKIRTLTKTLNLLQIASSAFRPFNPRWSKSMMTANKMAVIS